MEYEFLYGDTRYTVSLSREDGRLIATIGDESFMCDMHAISPNCLSTLIGGRSLDVYFCKADGKRYVFLDGQQFCFTLPDGEDEACGVAQGGGGESGLVVTAPMPGSVLKIHVSEGDKVEEGQCLAIVEAMKMETDLYATMNGRVKKIHAEAGKQVDAGEVLVELEEV